MIEPDVLPAFPRPASSDETGTLQDPQPLGHVSLATTQPRREPPRIIGTHCEGGQYREILATCNQTKKVHNSAVAVTGMADDNGFGFPESWSTHDSSSIFGLRNRDPDCAARNPRSRSCRVVAGSDDLRERNP